MGKFVNFYTMKRKFYPVLIGFIITIAIQASFSDVDWDWILNVFDEQKKKENMIKQYQNHITTIQSCDISNKMKSNSIDVLENAIYMIKNNDNYLDAKQSIKPIILTMVFCDPATSEYDSKNAIGDFIVSLVPLLAGLGISLAVSRVSNKK